MNAASFQGPGTAALLGVFLAVPLSAAACCTLPDTDQSLCFDTAAVVEEPLPGEPFYGQDAQYQGLQPAYRDNGDGTVTDLNTGLMWQQADDGTARNWEDALAFAEDLELAGYDDWRLPDAHELQSIVDYNRSMQSTGSPAIDPVFSCTQITDEGGRTELRILLDRHNSPENDTRRGRQTRRLHSLRRGSGVDDRSRLHLGPTGRARRRRAAERPQDRRSIPVPSRSWPPGRRDKDIQLRQERQEHRHRRSVKRPHCLLWSPYRVAVLRRPLVLRRMRSNHGSKLLRRATGPAQRTCAATAFTP